MCQAAGLLGGPFPFIFLHNTKELNAGGQFWMVVQEGKFCPCTQFGYVYPFLDKTLNQPRVLNAGSTKNTNAFFSLPAHLPV
jgi:hypothetical protein